MRKGLETGLIVLVFGLLLSANFGIAAGLDPAGNKSTGSEKIVTNTPNPEHIPGYSALPAQATAEFRIADNIEINVDQNTIPRGTFFGRQWGTFSIINTLDSSQTVLGNISETLEGDSFTQPEFPENATWNSTYVHWVFPTSFVLNESDKLEANYHTNALTPTYNPVELTRFVNKSVFLSDGYQFNSYEVNFEENMYENYHGRVAYEEQTYTNASVLFDTFTTDLPLTSRTNGSYLHPITEQYISEINFAFNNSSIQLHHPYHFNFTAAIRLTDNAGSPVKSYPRIFFSMDRLEPVQQGDQGITANMPSPLLPAHVTRATAATNVSNLWQYRHQDQVKLAFNQTAKKIGPENIGVFRSSTRQFIFNTSPVSRAMFGLSGDIPITGDWNGDSSTEAGVFRPSTRQFIFNTAPVTRATFGLSTDIPITGDWNGDGITDIGVFRPSARQFIFNTAPVTRTTFGLSTDIPITGDWNGDQITDIGVFRPSSRQFIFNTVPITRTTFGLSTDIPITGDWNGDGITEVGVFRPSTRQFIFNTAPVTRTTFGLSTDIPVTGKWG